MPELEIYLDDMFPNCAKLPWVTMMTHLLLRHKLGGASRGAAYVTVFHETLTNLYKNHVISSQTLFPGEGFDGMGLASGATMLWVDGI